jgi:hypothetical protein
MIMTPVGNLSTQIGDALLNLQLLEDGIRVYLHWKADIIRKSVHTIPSNFSLYDKRETLGTLIERFANVCGNKDLVKSLNKICKKRNNLVHKIWLDHRDEYRKASRIKKISHLQYMIEYSSVKSKEVQEIERETGICLEKILNIWETEDRLENAQEEKDDEQLQKGKSH